MASKAVASALNRFGMGARPGGLEIPRRDPREWLLGQLETTLSAGKFARFPGSAVYLERYYSLKSSARTASSGKSGQDSKAAPAFDRKALRQAVADESVARQMHAVTTPHGFAERIVRFWSNHFAISVDKRVAALFAAPMEREAIRPHAFGGFAEMLLAVERHPGMLLYLDNARSVGDQSMLQQRARKNANASRRGMNENLAREILELHTLGVDAGYAQADVQELARAITGWSVARPREAHVGEEAFRFRPAAHEPGSRRMLGKVYPEAGEAQGEAILRDLAIHPATARHLAFKLARHFVSDAPPAALVERMAKAYLADGGRLDAMYRALVVDDASWSGDACKFKTPDDFVISAMRACSLDAGDMALALRLQAGLGQPVFQPRSPAGFGDVAGDWGGSDALFKRVQAAQALAERVPTQASPTPVEVGEAVLGPGLDDETATALRRSESVQQGLAMLLASPAFQWRA